MDNQRSKWLVFACVAIAQFMVILDVTVTNVALPVIKVQLHFGNAAIGWVVTAYVLTFGGFLLFGGRAADLFGRRRMLLVGMVAFTVCSFLVGISPDPALLVVLRGAQGMSAALMSPAALSIVLATFGDGPQRNQALGYWSTIATQRGSRPAARRRADLVRGLAVELLHQRAGRRGDERGDRPGGAGLCARGNPGQARRARSIPGHGRADGGGVLLQPVPGLGLGQRPDACRRWPVRSPCWRCSP